MTSFDTRPTATPLLSADSATVSVVSDVASLSEQQRKRMLLGLGLATSIEFYTFDGVNLVLPDLAGSFGVSRDQASWILTTYSSAIFLGVPLSIWLAGHLRHRRFIIGSITLFAISSIACSLSTRFESMLFWRAVEGFAGSGLTMWWRASVYMLVERQHRSTSLMRISVMLYLATTVGLLFAGFVTDNISWRLIFVPNVIFAVASIGVLLRNYPDVPQRSDPRLRNVDQFGIALLGIAIISLQVILSRGEIDDWFGSSLIRSLVWISVLALLTFVIWETSAKNPLPLLRLHLLRTRPVLASMFLGIFAGIILSGSIYALPEFLRGVDPNQLSATDAGLIMCVYALTAASIRPLVTTSIAKFGQRKVVTFALVMLISSMLLFERLITIGTPVVYYIFPLMLYAFCLAPMLSSVGGGTVAKVAQEHQLDAVAIYMTFRQFGASLGVALITIVLHRRETLHSGRLFEHLREGNITMMHWTHAIGQVITARDGYSPVESTRMALKVLGEAGARQASALAYADAFHFMALIGIFCLCFVPIMPPTPVAKS
jgi:MFS transporter, DHA2 family, multidrug resistance protein